MTTAPTGGEASPRRLLLEIPYGRFALAISVLGLVGGAVALLWSGFSSLPVGARFLVGLVCFGFSPGVLLLVLIERPEDTDEDAAHLLVNAVGLTFSCNLVLNLILFALPARFRALAAAYVALQLIGYAACLATRHAGLRAFSRRRARASLSPATAVGIALLGAAFVGALYYTYQNAVCGAPIEELVVLRKLADSARVTYDGVSFVKGQPSTYLFVPFQVLIVGVSTISRLDVALVSPAFHVVTTFLGLAALVLLAWELFADALAVAALAGFLALAVATDLPGLLIDLGLGAPCPNRFGFAGGVLMPLALLMFYATLKPGRHRRLHTFLLIYLVVEMTFVHARETVFVLGCMAATSLALLPGLPSTAPALRRVGLSMAATVAVLLAYKHVNLALSPGLDEYVGLLTRESRAALERLVGEHGLAGALVRAGPGQIDIRFPEVDLTVPHAVAGYESTFLLSWNRLYFPCRLVLPLVLLALPFYALVARSLVELVLVAVLAGLGLVLSSGLLKLLLSAAVGNPEILLCYVLVYLIAFLLFARMVSLAAHALDTTARRATFSAGLIAACALMAALHFDGLRAALFRHWTLGVAASLHGTTLVAIAYRARRGLPLFPAPMPRRSRVAAAVVTALVGSYALLPLVRLQPWRGWLHDPLFPPSRFSGDLLQDLPLLVESNRIQGGLPVPIVSFLRRGVPPQRVVLGRNTVAVVASTSHFAAILAAQADEEVPRSFICNWPYLLKHEVRPGPFQLAAYVEAEALDRLQALLDDFGVDLVLVGPDENAVVAAAWRADPRLQRMLQRIYATEGYSVYAVARP